MALVLANGLDVAALHVVRPQRGVWHLDATVAAAEGIAQGDTVTVEIGGALSLIGRAVRAQAHEDALQLRVVAGGAGMASAAAAKFYQGAQARLVVTDLLAGAGEQLAAAADASILGQLLPAWSTFARPAAVELETLLRMVAATAAWRALEDGSVWIGPETWPSSGQVFELLERDPARRRITIGCEAPTLAPGSTLDGERIGDVEYVIGTKGATVIARLA